MPEEIDCSDAADAARFRWMLNSNPYYLEEMGLDCLDDEERNKARQWIDEEMQEEKEQEHEQEHE